MKAIDIIRKKRDGLELTKSEIDFLIDGYTNDLIPDYQMSALLMAIYFQKMSKIETVYLTQAIINSGEIINKEHFPRTEEVVIFKAEREALQNLTNY